MGGGQSSPSPQPSPPASKSPCAQTAKAIEWQNYTINQVNKNTSWPNQQALVAQLTGQLNQCNSNLNTDTNNYNGYVQELSGLQQDANLNDEQIEYLNYQDLGAYYAYYENIGLQNKTIQNLIAKLKEAYSADNQRVFYEAQRLNNLDSVNNLLWWLYWGMALVLLIIVIYKAQYSWTAVWLMIIIVLYPFFIYQIETVVFFVYKLFVSTLRQYTYASSY
jgi:hypothetical protein